MRVQAAVLESFAVASGGLLSIGSILVVLLLLSTRGGAGRAAAWYAGYGGGYLAMGQGLLVLGHHVAATTPATNAEPGRVGPAIAVLLGALLLFFGLRRWRRPPAPDAPPPRLFAQLDQLSLPRAFGFGLLVTVINLKNLAIYLSAIGILAEARLPLDQALPAGAAVTLLFTSAVLAPLVVYALLRARADPWLSAFRRVLERHSRPLTIGVMLLFGTLFLLRGLFALA